MKCPFCNEEIPETEVVEEFMDDDTLMEMFGNIKVQLDRLTIRSDN